MNYKEEYLDKFINNTCDRSQQRKQVKSALLHAMDIRKFEIELYWKRTGYFWAFIVVIYGVYGWIQGGMSNTTIRALDINRDIITISSHAHEELLPFLISSVGLIVTFSWNLVNRGSKFWQNNWERHVDILEDYIHGPLYKTILFEKNDLNYWKLFYNAGAYPISVTKINQWLSIIAMWGAVFVFGKEFLYYTGLYENVIIYLEKLDVCIGLLKFIIGSLVLFVTFFIMFFMFKKSKSNLGSDFKKKCGGDINGGEVNCTIIAYRKCNYDKESPKEEIYEVVVTDSHNNEECFNIKIDKR